MLLPRVHMILTSLTPVLFVSLWPVFIVFLQLCL